jgi:MFS transporter, PHS family, inorganic phosphate transporter
VKVSASDPARDPRFAMFQFDVLMTAGLGFVTDAYDLFIMGIVLVILRTQWHLTVVELSLLGSTALVSAGLGALVFGRLFDLFRPKRVYTIDLLILAAGAFGSAFVPDIWWLLLCRFVVGVAVGGGYPISATIMSAYAAANRRGQMVSMVFAAQGIGLTLGPIIALLALKSGLSTDVAWRVLLALGGLPPLLVFYFRHRMHRSRYYHELREMVHAQPHEATTIARTDPRIARWLLGASAAWFLFDVAYYGNALTAPVVLSLIQPHAALEQHLVELSVIFALFALPGYLFAIGSVERFGHKRIQIFGFAMLALAFVALAVVPKDLAFLYPLLFAYGLSYFFANFGPNTTTYGYPARIFPLPIRGTAGGIAAFSGKAGAFIGTFIFPPLLAGTGLKGTMSFVAVICVAGVLATLAFLPDPNKLDDLDRPQAP